MKKLKLQKALLAICLALPITLKMTNATNAMEKQKAPNSQIPNHNDPTQQIETNTAFTFQFWKYIQDRIQGRPKDTALTQEEYATFLQKYINDDIAKFIAVYILTNHKQIKPTKNPKIANLIDETTLHTALTKDIKNPTVAMFRQLHNDIYEKIDAYGKDTRTNAEKILLLLCEPLRAGAQDTNQAREQIRDLINRYDTEPINLEDSDDKTLQIVLSALEQTAQLIKSDYQYQQQNGEKATTLGELAQLVQDFSDAYKKKPSAFTQDINIALVEQNVDIKKIDTLTDQQAQQLLQRHIKNDISKYLALMLLANFNEIPLSFENALGNFILKDPQIYTLLFDNPPKDLNIIDNEEIKGQLDNILQELRDIKSKDGNRTPEEEIISLFFIQHPENTWLRGIITKTLPEKIQQYIQNKYTPVAPNHSTLIGFLDKVPDPIILQSQLLNPGDLTTARYKLANAVREFSKAYKDKLQQQIQDKNAKLGGIIKRQEDKKHQNTKQANFAKLKNKTQTIQQPEPQKSDIPNTNNSQQQPQQPTQQKTHPNNNKADEQTPIRLADTYYKSMAQFKLSRQNQQLLNDQDYKDFLQLYIGEDIIRYLSLLILSNTALLTHLGLLTNQGKLPIQEFHEINQINKHLLEYKIPENAPSQQPQTNEAPTNNGGNRKQFLNMQNAICHKQKKLYVFPTSTPITQILSFLFYDKGKYHTIEENLAKLKSLTNQNYTDIDNFCDEPYPTLISYLKPVANQLQQEHLAPNANDANNYLVQLAQILIKFSQEYRQQLTNKVAKTSSKSQTISDKKDKENNGNFTNDNNRVKQETNKMEEETDKSNSNTAQETMKHGLAGKILANLKRTTEKLSKIIKILLP